MITINSNRFAYDKNTMIFSGEASDMPGYLQALQDHCFAMRSMKTGKVAMFGLKKVEHDDGEGDILAWHFEPTDNTLLHNPQLKGVKVVIFND